MLAVTVLAVKARGRQLCDALPPKLAPLVGCALGDVVVAVIDADHLGSGDAELRAHQVAMVTVRGGNLGEKVEPILLACREAVADVQGIDGRQVWVEWIEPLQAHWG